MSSLNRESTDNDGSKRSSSNVSSKPTTATSRERESLRIGVVGGGTVGTAIARTYLEHADVRVYDILATRRTHSFDETITDSDIVFVCLPTPQVENCLYTDLHFLSDFFHEVQTSDRCFVLRSTVPIGTTTRLRGAYRLKNLVHSPEFLTARCAVTDAMVPSRNIIGGEACLAKALLAGLYAKRFPGVEILQMTSEESEAVKLFANGFFSVKVSYFNEVRALADHLGLNWSVILQGILSDGRISHSHTQVPGPDGKRGFGGACLPKDLANLISCFDNISSGKYPLISTAAYNRNLKDRGDES